MYFIPLNFLSVFHLSQFLPNPGISPFSFSPLQLWLCLSPSSKIPHHVLGRQQQIHLASQSQQLLGPGNRPPKKSDMKERTGDSNGENEIYVSPCFPKQMKAEHLLVNNEISNHVEKLSNAQ